MQMKACSLRKHPVQFKRGDSPKWVVGRGSLSNPEVREDRADTAYCPASPLLTPLALSLGACAYLVLQMPMDPVHSQADS